MNDTRIILSVGEKKPSTEERSMPPRQMPQPSTPKAPPKQPNPQSPKK